MVGSIYILNEYLQSGDIQFELFPQVDADGIRIITYNFTRIRNNFISKISNSTLRCEQMFANLVSVSDIGRLDPTRSLHNVDDFDRCSSIYHNHQPESGERVSIGVTYKMEICSTSRSLMYEMLPHPSFRRSATTKWIINLPVVCTIYSWKLF